MFNGMIIASVNRYNQGTTDKNGKEPVILNVIAGKCPNRTVLAGTIAETMGIEIGKTYLFSVREGNPDEQYGRRFVFSSLKELQAMEIIEGQKMLGVSEVFSVEGKEEDTLSKASTSFHEANQ